MKCLRTLTHAATLALIGMAGGYAGDAQAQARPATGTVLLTAGSTVVGMGDVQGDGALTLSRQNTYTGQTTVNQGVLNQKGSLQRLGSINDLFANSRGGDQAAGAHGAGGGGGAGKVAYQDTNYGKPGDGSVMPTDQLANPSDGGTQLPAVQKVREAANRASVNTTGMPTDLGAKPTTPQPLLLPAVQAAREAARSSSSTGGGQFGGGQSGGGQVAGGATTMTMQNTARK